jgi:hypothetical protein
MTAEQVGRRLSGGTVSNPPQRVAKGKRSGGALKADIDKKAFKASNRRSRRKMGRALQRVEVSKPASRAIWVHARLTGKHVNAQDANGDTALHFAAGMGWSEVLTLLLKRGAGPLIENRQGQTPLHAAANAGSFACCYSLIAAGAPVHHRDKQGRTALALRSPTAGMHLMELLVLGPTKPIIPMQCTDAHFRLEQDANRFAAPTNRCTPRYCQAAPQATFGPRAFGMPVEMGKYYGTPEDVPLPQAWPASLVSPAPMDAPSWEPSCIIAPWPVQDHPVVDIAAMMGSAGVALAYHWPASRATPSPTDAPSWEPACILEPMPVRSHAAVDIAALEASADVLLPQHWPTSLVSPAPMDALSSSWEPSLIIAPTPVKAGPTIDLAGIERVAAACCQREEMGSCKSFAAVHQAVNCRQQACTTKQSGLSAEQDSFFDKLRMVVRRGQGCLQAGEC